MKLVGNSSWPMPCSLYWNICHSLMYSNVWPQISCVVVWVFLDGCMNNQGKWTLWANQWGLCEMFQTKGMLYWIQFELLICLSISFVSFSHDFMRNKFAVLVEKCGTHNMWLIANSLWTSFVFFVIHLYASLNIGSSAGYVYIT